MDYERVMILKEKGGTRYLPISVNSIAANAINIYLHEQPLPNTPYDFISSLIKGLDVILKEVIVDELEKGIFHAKSILIRGDQTFQIPCNPGDAIAIALGMKSPIFVTEDILAKTSIAVGEIRSLTQGRDETNTGSNL